jgi:mono/diheme cytochrome c family protein
MRSPAESRFNKWLSTSATVICAAALCFIPRPASAAASHSLSTSAPSHATPQQTANSTSDAAEGEALFLGRKPLESGGPPCKTCHGISNLSVSHGPTPGPNLTTEYSRFSADALDKYLQEPPVRPMSVLFKEHPIMPTERRQLIAFLRHVNEANPSYMPPPPPTPETIAAGKALFAGSVRLQNGGPACITCHVASGLPFPKGGTMGPDLTREYSELGPLGLNVSLRTLDFPSMTALYQKRQLTAAEQQQLAAFFQSIYQRRLPVSTTRAIVLAAAAWLGVLLLCTWLAASRRHARLARQRLRNEPKPRKRIRKSPSEIS